MLKNLIFDVGGVLLEYRWREALTDIGCDEAAAGEIGEKMLRDPVWRMMDYGVMTIEEVIEKFYILYPGQADWMARIMRAPRSLAVPRPEIWEKLRGLKEAGYKIFILSNYGEELWNAHAAFRPFMQDAEDVIVSCRIHMLKPERRIYDYALEKFGIEGEESVFFDDRSENTAAARDAGIPAVTVKSRESLNGLLGRLLREGEAALSGEE